MNADNPQRQTIVIGGSYPGALSAWFRTRYPHIALASWASSAVVQPIVEFTKFDEQVYTSSVKSGEFCPKMILKTQDFITIEGSKRVKGNTDNLIDLHLKDTPSAGMRTDDFMFYYADIFVESVQYGNRTKLCDLLKSLEGNSWAEIFKAITDFGSKVANVNPPDYDTRELAKTEIDFQKNARQWTYQYCT